MRLAPRPKGLASRRKSGTENDKKKIALSFAITIKSINMEQKNILKIIQENYDRLGPRQRKLADYILSHSDEAAFMTAGAMGEAAGVSEATVLRFAGVLGMEGFGKFQEQLKEEILSRVSVTRRMEQTYADVDRSRLLDEVLETDMLLFSRTRQMISEKAFNLSLDLLESARDIYIIGLRGSAPLAQYLYFQLRLIFNHVILVSSSSEHELLEQLIHVDEQDTVVGISFPRYSFRTLRMLEFANARRAGIITLTDSMRAPVNLYSTCTLTAAADISSVAGSLTAAMGVVDAIITALSVRNSAAIEKNMELLESTLSDYQVSGNDEMDMMEQGVQLHFPVRLPEEEQ